MSIVILGLTSQTIDPRGASPAGFDWETPMRKSQVTYLALSSAMAAQCGSALSGTVSQRLRNLRSALNAWLDCHGLTVDSSVGPELTDEFDKSLQYYLETLAKRRLGQQTLRDRKAHMGRWQELAKKLTRLAQEQTDGPERFTRLLRNLVAAKQMPPKTIARQAGVNHNTFYRWLEGAIPNIRVKPAVHRLEVFLDVPRNTLSDLVHWSDGPHDKSAIARPVIGYRELLKRLSQTSIRIMEVPATLRDEWLDLLEYKTSSYSFRLKRQPRGVWRLRPLDDLSSDYNQWYALASPGKVAPTAVLSWQLVTRFYGWLTLPAEKGGHGIPLSDAGTLGWMARADVVRAYLSWQLSRSEGVMHNGLAVVCQFMQSLVHPTTGYLSQQPEFNSRLPDYEQSISWSASCADTYSVLRDFRRAIAEKRQLLRDPFEPIRAIIDSEQPVRYVMQMIAAMKADARCLVPGSLSEAVQRRDILLICMLCANPLRIAQYRLLRYRDDNSGNLFRDTNGTWWLRFNPSNFKNERGAARDRPYQVQVPQQLYPLIEDYLASYRPRIERVKSDYFFISSNEVRQGKPWPNINRTVFRLTRRYIPGSPGFGPHAFRHIVATDWLKSHPEDYPTVAAMLHDKLETVLRHYGCLQPEDGHRPYRGHFSRLFSESVG